MNDTGMTWMKKNEKLSKKSKFEGQNDLGMMGWHRNDDILTEWVQNDGMTSEWCFKVKMT